MEQLKLKVSNVKCGGCVSAIQTGLQGMPGIAAVEVDIPTGIVTLETANPDLPSIKEKLRELGYPAID